MANGNKKLFAAERALLERQGQLPDSKVAQESSADTDAILEAIKDLKDTIVKNTDPRLREDLPELQTLREQLIELKSCIDDTKKEIAAVRHPEATDDRLTSAAMELDAIVKSTEDATHNILSATEDIQDKLLSIRDRVGDVTAINVLDEIGNLTIKIFENCNFQDITGQRTNKVVKTIYFLEDRIMKMIDIWGGAEEFKELAHEQEEMDEDAKLLEGPQHEGEGVSQADIDALFD